MFKRKFWFFFLVAILLAAGGIYFHEKRNLSVISGGGKKPNVIIISVDSLRSDHVGVCGYQRQTTPNIDKLAKEGVMFKNYITQSYITPVSEMSMLTSTYPSASALVAMDTVSSEGILTIAQILQKYGYRTGAFGNSPEYKSYPAMEKSFSRGFDEYSVGMRREILPEQQKIFNFASEKSDKPFFLWIPLGSAHYPYGKFAENFSDPNYNGPLKSQNLDWFNGIIPWIYKNTLYQTDSGQITAKIPLSQADIQYVIDKYDGDIFGTDAWVGGLLDKLKEEGLDKNTIIVLQSEHGEDLNEHNYIHHYDIFDTMTRTPLIIKNPNSIRNNLILDDQTQSINVLPTILDYLDIPSPHQAVGVSLKPLIENNEKVSANDYIFIERTPLWEKTAFGGPAPRDDLSQVKEFLDRAKGRITAFYTQEDLDFITSPNSIHNRDVAVRTPGWKLIYRASKDFQEKYSWWNILSGEHPAVSEFELYDLKTDPTEQHNVIDRYPDIASQLEEKLIDFYNKTKLRDEPEIKKPIYDYF